MHRSYRYRLYPNRQQSEALGRVLEIHRQLYNAALQERQGAWRKCRVSINFYDQSGQLKTIRAEDEDVAWLNYSSIQRTLRRLDKAFQSFFRRVKAGQKPGYPRFKSRRRWKSVVYTFRDGAAFSNGRLRIQNVGKIKVKWHRPIPAKAKIKTTILKRMGNKWYAIFQLELPDLEPLGHEGPAVGIDLGLKTFAALSTGECIGAPKYFCNAQKKLRRQQRRVSRRKWNSNHRRRAVRQVAKTHEHIANQRRDFHHKLSRRLVNEFSFIAIEDLNIEGLGKSMLSKSIHDAGWSAFLQMLGYKAAGAGSQIVSVNPRYTSQACSRCGCIVKKDLSTRVHDCPHCGLVLNRDHNAAINILNRALNKAGLALQTPTWPVGACVVCEAA